MLKVARDCVDMKTTTLVFFDNCKIRDVIATKGVLEIVQNHLVVRVLLSIGESHKGGKLVLVAIEHSRATIKSTASRDVLGMGRATVTNRGSEFFVRPEPSRVKVSQGDDVGVVF